MALIKDDIFASKSTKKSSYKPSKTLEEKKADTRDTGKKDITEQSNGDSERSKRTVLDELKNGVKETKRITKRFSFEIYEDMIPRMEDLQYRFKKQTRKKLPVSRIIREALEEYLSKFE